MEDWVVNMPIQISLAQRNALIKGKAALDEAAKEIAKAKRAGLDTTEMEAKLKQAQDLRDGLLREYGGGVG